MKDFNKLDEEMVSRFPNLASSTNIRSEIFADIVFSYRVRECLTQHQLAEKSGVDIKTIHRIEGCSGGIEDIVYEKVINALELDWNEVLEAINK